MQRIGKNLEYATIWNTRGSSDFEDLTISIHLSIIS